MKSIRNLLHDYLTRCTITQSFTRLHNALHDFLNSYTHCYEKLSNKLLKHNLNSHVQYQENKYLVRQLLTL